MAEQKAKARAAWAGSGEAADEAVWFDLAERLGPTEFLGYDTEAAEGQILALLVGGHPVESAEVGVEVQIVLNQTPFYAESGGQVGDTGTLRTDKARVRVTDVRKKAGLFVHTGRVEEGTLARGAAAELAVDHDRRSAIRANHSATHLLHEALRRALGDHVAQRGSLVAPDRLRFDFAHPKAMTADELAAVEAEVNAYVRQNTPVETRIMTPDAAAGLGARALFGEKYGDEVRVVSMGARPGSGLGAAGDTYSLELCGGTHVAPHRRHRRLQARLRGRDLERRPPRRGADRRGRARPRRRRGEGARRSRGAAARPPRGAARAHPRPARRAPVAGERDRRAAPPPRARRRPGRGEGTGDRRRRSRSSPRASPASPARTCAA